MKVCFILFCKVRTSGTPDIMSITKECMDEFTFTRIDFEVGDVDFVVVLLYDVGRCWTNEWR